MIAWDQVPARHQGRDYEWTPGGVRVSCLCGWRSTLARTLHDAITLWTFHIRQVLRDARP